MKTGCVCWGMLIISGSYFWKLQGLVPARSPSKPSIVDCKEHTQAALVNLHEILSNRELACENFPTPCVNIRKSSN
jgi:hypothetical protein